MDALRIHFFGGFLLTRGDVALPPIASRAGRSLFAYLVMNRGRPIQRDLLAGSFWPDLPDTTARRRLSQTLWQIQDVVNGRQTLPVSVTGDTLAFNTSTPYWLDVEEFDRSFEEAGIDRQSDRYPGRLDMGALRDCVELYRGDLLAGFFDDWVIVHQDHYQNQYLRALKRLIDGAKADGAYEEALVHARRLTHHDPLSEDTHREVMRLCFLLGRTSDAIEQYERCRSILAEELDAEPSQTTVDLYRKIVRQRTSGVVQLRENSMPLNLGPQPTAPFAGREDERRGMIDCMERVLAGPGGVVLVEGEPGVGKSRLVTEAAEDAKWRGFEVSWGTCTAGALRPFAPLAEILDSLSQLRVDQLVEQVEPIWLNEALRLAPRLQEGHGPIGSSPRLKPDEESSRMKEALVNTLGALGQVAPHLVVIDDVQWADRDTMSVLTQLGSRLADSRILLLLIYRSEEARSDPETWDALRELDRIGGLSRVVLSALSVFELNDMVKRILGIRSIESKISTLLHQRTGGNALFAVETLLAIRDQGMFEAGNPTEVLRDQLTTGNLPLAPRVMSVINDRMSMLGETTAAVYEAAAVCGSESTLRLLAAGVALSRPSAANAVNELLHRGLLQESAEGRYRLSHDQVRQVVYDRIDAPRRALLHRRLAEALSDAEPVDVAAVGYHFVLSDEPTRAVHYLVEAGRRARQLNAYATASEHFHSARALALQAGWSDDDRFNLLGELETVLAVLGQREDQQDVLDEMSRLVESTHQLNGEIERRRGWLLAHRGEFLEAEKAAARSVDIERLLEDETGLAASLVALGTTLRWSGQSVQAVEPLEEAVAASPAGSLQRADAHTELASTLVEQQRFSEGQSHLQNALEIEAGRSLVRDIELRLAQLMNPLPGRPTYAEIWLGRHMRTLGGRTFISDMIELAGGQNIYADRQDSYFEPDFDDVAECAPEVIIGFSEPEHPVDFDELTDTRNWHFDHSLVTSDVKKGQNLIQEGPSIVDTIEWLADQYRVASPRHRLISGEQKRRRFPHRSAESP